MDNFGPKEGFTHSKSPLQVIKEAEEELANLDNEQLENLDHVSSMSTSQVENMELTFIPDFICHDFTNFQPKRQYKNSNFAKNDIAEDKGESFIMDITTCDPTQQILERPTKENELKYFYFNDTQVQLNRGEFDDEMELTMNIHMDDTLLKNDSILQSMDETSLDLWSENVNVYNEPINFNVEHTGINVQPYDYTKSLFVPIERKDYEVYKNIAEKDSMNKLKFSVEKDTDEIDHILLSIKNLFQQNGFDNASNLLEVNENILFIRYLFQRIGYKDTNSRGKIIQDVPQTEIYDDWFIDHLFQGNYGSLENSSLKHNTNETMKNMQLLPYVNLDEKFNLNRIFINMIPPIVSKSQIMWLQTINIPSFITNLNKIQSKVISPFMMDKQQSTNLYSNCKIIMRKKSLQHITDDTEFKQIEDVCNKIDEAIGEELSYKNEFSHFVTAIEEDKRPHLKVKNKKNYKDNNKQGLLRGYFSKMGRGNRHDKGENKENNEIITDKGKKPQPVLKDINEFKLFSLLKKVKEKERAKEDKKEPPTPNSSRKKFWTLPANNKITRRNQHVVNKDDIQTKDGLIKRNWDFLRETLTKKLN